MNWLLKVNYLQQKLSKGGYLKRFCHPFEKPGGYELEAAKKQIAIKDEALTKKDEKLAKKDKEIAKKVEEAKKRRWFRAQHPHHKFIIKELDNANSIHAFNRFKEEGYVERFQCHFRLADLARDALYALAKPTIYNSPSSFLCLVTGYKKFLLVFCILVLVWGCYI